MKTGRLLKLRVADGEVHAYIYRDHGRHHAAIYVDAARGGSAPDLTLHGESEDEVESAVRSWVADHQAEAR